MSGINDTDNAIFQPVSSRLLTALGKKPPSILFQRRRRRPQLKKKTPVIQQKNLCNEIVDVPPIITHEIVQVPDRERVR